MAKRERPVDRWQPPEPRVRVDPAKEAAYLEACAAKGWPVPAHARPLVPDLQALLARLREEHQGTTARPAWVGQGRPWVEPEETPAWVTEMDPKPPTPSPGTARPAIRDPSGGAE
jgi:hypothetical protein